MRRLFLSSLFYLLFGSLIGLEGCSNSNESNSDVEGEETPELALGFTFTVKRSGATRSETETSIYYDQEIDPTSVQVSLWDENGKYVTTITTLQCYCDSEDEASKTYRYYGTFHQQGMRSGHYYRCMVVANCGTVDFEHLTSDAPVFNATDLPQGSDTSYALPMWGVSTFPLVVGINEQDAGEIALMRAATKCRIHLSEELIQAGYTLSNGIIHRFNRQGYVVPEHATEVATTSDISYDTTNKYYGFHPLSDWNSEGTRDLMFEPGTAVSDTEATSLIGYIPEASNEVASPTYLTLDVTSTKYDLRSNYTVDFKDYASDELFTNLQRNQMYDFEIISVKYGIQMRVSVSDWEEVSETWDFSEQISGDLEISWNKGTYSSLSTLETTDEETTQSITLLSGIAAVGTFSINSPSGATWYAALTGESGNFIAFESEKDGVTQLTSSLSGETGTQAILRIRSTLTNNTQQHSAKLTVVVRYKDGTSRKVESLSCWEIIQPI